MSEVFDTSRQNSEHEELCQLIPWYLNGTLSDSEHRRVQEHLVTCLVCRGDLKLQRKVAQSVTEEDIDSVTLSYNLTKLRQQIAACPGSQSLDDDSRERIYPSPGTSSARERFRHSALAMAAAITVAAVGLGVFWQSTGQGSRYPSGEYQTLSSPGQESAGSFGELFVAFEQGVTDTAVSNILIEYGLEPVFRSEDQRLWRVRLLDGGGGEDRVSLAVSKLGADESVLFVERVIIEE